MKRTQKKILGREQELATLNEFYRSTKAQFLALYGRRRIGKTFLIREFAQAQSEAIFFDVTGIHKGSKQEQITSFEDSFQRVFNHEHSIRFTTWRQAFKALTKEIKKRKEKIIVFLDELPWLATPKSNLISNVDYFWNTEWSRLDNVKLVICGSAAAWMIDNVINDKGGLHNRTTHRINLQAFKLKEVKSFLDAKGVRYTDNQVIQSYLAVGGVAYYLDNFKKSLSPEQNIDKLCFTENGILVNEYNLLFASLFKNSEEHVKVIELLSKRRTGVRRSVIEEKIKGNITRILSQIEAAGFIKKYTPYGKNKRDSYYRVIDEYSLFYKYFIQPVMHSSFCLLYTSPSPRD